MKKLPPLSALKAFESAARHLSVTLAAEELNVTPGAVSRQVRQLEAFLATPLFLRGHQQIVLTRQGAEYFRTVFRALNDVREATAHLGAGTRKQALYIRAYTTFSMHWLIPRLSDFQARHPDIQVSLTTSLDDVDFDREDVDGAIRLGDGKWRGAHSYRLVPNVLCTVMSPKLLARGPRLKTPSDLSRHTLLHSLARADDWGAWLASANVHDVDPRVGTTFQSSVMAYAAAIQGQGIAMAQRFLVEKNLRDGELVMPFEHVLDRGAFTYYLITASDRAERPQMAAFRQWMLECVSAGG
ncbi:transcriptional regulator GcvA [Achromobacter xylosoxidans]|uniref:Transcriptional regulator GcvA n=1 Tax=Alcaligenes xylosoxydans xylosoxydans TaxID=85698 RepID=A0A9X3L3Z9_ALCXX|nr:transcriptional regulator GcvA [Achromobacter xylosoxidans]MCZ8405367.1 transcriptional regulator GcvA [Achromobacter xylosoxidans]